MKKNILSIIAILISFLSLFISLWQINISLEHNKLTTLPRLYIFEQFGSNQKQPGLYLENRGNGGATIINTKIGLDNKNLGEMRQDTWSDFRSFSGLYSLGETTTLSLEKNCLIPPSYQNSLLIMNIEKDHSDLRRVKQIMVNRINIKISYKGMYGNCEMLIYENGKSYWENISCPKE